MLEPAPLLGLVLAGGKSTRMGEDKANIQWHGVPQWRYVAEQLRATGLPTFISVAASQKLDYPDQVQDTYPETGPIGGIRTAMEAHPNHAFLVAACDMPLLTTEVFDYLISKRNPKKIASLPIGPKGFPEPLIAIWEPAVADLIRAQMNTSNYRLKDLLGAEKQELISVPWPNKLLNVNRPDEKTALESMLRS